MNLNCISWRKLYFRTQIYLEQPFIVISPRSTLVWYSTVWFYGVSAILGYLLLNPILYI